MKLYLTWLFLLAVILLQASTAWDQDLKIRSCTALEWNQTAVPVPGGGQLFVWSDSRADDRNIYAQMVNATGSPVWDSPVAIDVKAHVQRSPVVTVTSDGFFVIAWIDTDLDSRGNVYLQKINAQGQLLWPVGGIRASVSSNCREIKIVADNLGGVIVAWNRYSYDDNTELSYAQSFDASGDGRWSESGIQITTDPYYLLTSMIADGNNGFYTAASSNYVGNSTLTLKRYNTDGILAWDNPIVIGDDNSLSRLGLLALGQDAVYLYWHSEIGGTQAPRLQAFSPAGTALWAEPVIIVNLPNTVCTPEHVSYSQTDNSILLATRVNGNQDYLFVDKYSSTGLNLWTNVVGYDLATEYDYSGKLFLEADGSGGAYLAWNSPFYQTNENNVYAQHLSSTGTELWQAGGVNLSYAVGNQYNPYLCVQGQDVWAAWLGQPAEEQGIWFQKLGNNGLPLLEINGRHLYGGLTSMYTEGRFTVTRSNDVAILWDDDRMAPNQSQIRLQTVNSNGAFGFAENGILITEYHPCTQYITNATVLANDRIVVLWNERQEAGYSLYAQLLDASGNRLWGDYGIRLNNSTDGYDSYTAVSEIGSDIFIGWSHMTSTSSAYVGQIFMQKITNGQIQWTSWGKDMFVDAALCSNRLKGIYSDYLVYEHHVLAQGHITEVYAMRFNPADGNPQTAWGTIGLPVDPANTEPVFLRYFLNAKLTPQGLIVVFVNHSVDFVHNIMAQRFSPEGQLLWGQSAAIIRAGVNNGYSSLIQFGQNDLVLAWTEQPDINTTIIKTQSWDYSLTPLWEPLMITSDALASYTMSVTRDANNTLTFVWTRVSMQNENSIIYRFVNAAGELIGNDDQHQIDPIGFDIFHLQTANYGTNTMLTWSQGSSMYRDEPMEHQNLMAQLIINQTSPVDDPQAVPMALISAVTNYPNPFNPTTTIAYNLAQATKVEIGIYNLKGQLVCTLLNDSKTAGQHRETWNGTDSQGKAVSTGIYFYRITAAKQTKVGKMILIK